jgi:tRNA(Arg) A34 adenosine deaminase TadA
MCQGAIQWARIGRVYYGCTAADAEQIGFDDARFQKEQPEMLPLEREACLEVFAQYEAMPDKERY